MSTRYTLREAVSDLIHERGHRREFLRWALADMDGVMGERFWLWRVWFVCRLLGHRLEPWDVHDETGEPQSICSRCGQVWPA